MKTEKWSDSGTVTKVPQVQISDAGTYTCTVHLWGNSTGVLAAHVDVTVDGERERELQDENRTTVFYFNENKLQTQKVEEQKHYLFRNPVS